MKPAGIRNGLDASVEADGFAIARGVLDEGAVSRLCRALSELRPERAGVRSVSDRVTAVRQLAGSREARDLVAGILGSNAFLVRSIYFDKSQQSNWSVPWHQDLTIAVRERCEAVGYGPWSQKDGAHHVQPPVSVLEQMLTLRFHLDDADEGNGALLVLPRTHVLGRLSQQRVDELAPAGTPVVCRVRAGDVVLMRPLLLHASRKSTRDARRRVVHLEFAAVELPSPLKWA